MPPWISTQSDAVNENLWGWEDRKRGPSAALGGGSILNFRSLSFQGGPFGYDEGNYYSEKYVNLVASGSCHKRQKP